MTFVPKPYRAIHVLSKNRVNWQAVERLKALADWLNSAGREAFLRD